MSSPGRPDHASPLLLPRLHDFHHLMRFRIMDVLLVASPYDWFLLEEAGQLSERLLGEFRNLDLHYGPGLTGVSTGAEALALAREPGRFQLILTALRLSDLTAPELARRVAAEGLDVPVVGLAFDNGELKDFVAHHDLSGLERVFLWQGDARILSAIVKSVEDRRNVAHDTEAAGVQVVVLVEDNVRYYSSFLPTIYEELLHHSQKLLADSLNLSHKILRMRARPKILLCATYEEAWEACRAYPDDLLGLISDVEFPRDGARSLTAGLDLARGVRESFPDLPVLLHSSRPEHEASARALGADFLLKGSPLLLHELRRFITQYFGFGDFVFRLPGGEEVARASDLRGLEEAVRVVPGESLAFHAERHHFSKWLKARTEFVLAQELRPQKLSDFVDVEALRGTLVRSLAAYRKERSQAAVADFERDTFDRSEDFYRIGGGSLGGKARGLAFVRLLLSARGLSRAFAGVEVKVPPAVVLGTDVFDRFLEENRLRDFAIHERDDARIAARFLEARFPGEAERDLEAFLARADYPLAVRSSSLLEDSQYQPFTGVYNTYMLPNNHPFLDVRLRQLLRAVKRVYASTFSRRAKAYIEATPYRLEEEKMAVILQQLVGAAHGRRFYPDFAGVARSHNFYPAAPLRPEDASPRSRWASDARWWRAATATVAAALPAAAPAVRDHRGGAARLAAGVLGGGSHRAGAGSRSPAQRALLRPGRGGARRYAGRGGLHVLARERRPLRRHRPQRRAGGYLRAGAEARPVPAGRGAGQPAGAGRLGHGRAGGVRVRGESGGLTGRPSGVRGAAAPPAGPLARARGAGAGGPGRRAARCRSSLVLGHGRIADVRDLVVVDQGPALRARAEPADGGGAGTLQRRAGGGGHALPADRRGALGLGRPLAGHPGDLGPDLRRPCDRGGGIPRLPGDALAGHALLPEPHVLQRGLLHGQPRRRRRLPGLGLAGRPHGTPRDFLRAPPALREARGREDGRPARPGSDPQAGRLTAVHFWHGPRRRQVRLWSQGAGNRPNRIESKGLIGRATARPLH